MMRRLPLLMLLLVASLAMPHPALSQEASDLFLQAYQDFQSGEKLEREAEPRAALEKYLSAQKALQEVLRTAPDWQPLVVEYRLKKTQENIARLEPEVARLPPEVEPIEGQLPVADRTRPAMPVVTSAPPISVRPPPSAPPGRRVQATPTEPSTYPGRSGTSVLEQRIQKLERDLQAEKDRNEKLNARLQSALLEVDKWKVNVVDLKSQLAQANTALENTMRDGDSLSIIRAEFDKKVVGLLNDLAKAEAEREVLEDENARLFAKLERAAQYITESDTIRTNLLEERTKLAKARDEALFRTKKIKDNTAEIERITGENKQLKADLSFAAKNTVAREEFEKLTAQNKELAEKLTAAEKLAVSPEEREKIAAEKKVAEDQLAQARKDLEEARNSPNPERDKLIATLQSDLNSVNDKLLEAQAQVSRAEEEKKALQKQLDEVSGQLAQITINPQPSDEETSLATENELLRGIILRQIKQQAERDEAKKDLEKEIAALQIKSEVITRQLAVLGAPVLQLTEAERTLFKEPVALLSESGTDSVEVTMAVAKPGTDSATEPAKSPDEIPEDVRTMVVEAKELFERKDYAGTERMYQQIVERVPDNYFALSNLAAVQIESGKLSAAEVALKKAVEINPNDSFAYTNLGILYSRQGKFEDAIAALKQAITLNEKDSVAHNYLGVCLGQKDLREDAEKQFKRAIELNEGYPDAHFNLAVLYATTQPQSMELAKHYYIKATELGAAPDPSLERLIQ